MSFTAVGGSANLYRMTGIKSFRFVAAILGALLLARGAEAEKPNLVFILADDLGYGDLGCYGQKRIQTPHLDRLADEGMKFTQFYAGSTVCAPSRCVLMTGLHTGHCWVRGNAGGANMMAQTLRDEDRTVAEVFKDAGYATAQFGKWGLGELGSPGHPNRQGFDYFYGYLSQHHAHNYYPSFLIRNDEIVRLRNVPAQETPGRGDGWAKEKIDYSHDLIMAEALQWLGAHRTQSFFLYLSLTIPHANNEASRATGNGQEIPDYGIYAQQDWPDPDKGQAAMITRMDRDIGRLLAQLKEYQLDENTLVLFSSDNGPHKEGGNNPDFFEANGPLRGMKRALYEGGIRVPMLARWPGKVPSGKTSDHLGYFGDLFATVCELTGQPTPAGLDSISFLPALLGKTQDQKQHDYLYWEFYEQGSRQAVRFGDWKAIRQPMRQGKIELYNLAEDLGETTDLASSQPEKVAQAARLLDQAHRPDPKWKVPARR